MTPEQWNRLKLVFHEAVQKPAGERSDFVAELKERDAFLGEELDKLLRSHEAETSVLDGSFANFGEALPDTVPTLAKGTVIAGRFEIVRFLGCGGMGEVYEANDFHLGRVALKTIRQEIADRPDILARFRHEVALARKVTGPNVCRIHELFIAPEVDAAGPSAFLTMEFLDGVTLADRLDKEGPLPVQEAEQIAIQVCSGLQTIHDAGVIHRDLKSRNIMLAQRNGRACAVVMDFGLAHETAPADAASRARLTSYGTVLGTPGYMAPEQFQGERITSATDIYALGVLLYEMVTGKLPFNAATPFGAAEQRAKLAARASAVRSGLPRRWDRVIGRCISYEPARRYQTPREVADALCPKSYRQVFTSRAVATFAVLLACIGLGFLFWYLSHNYRPPPQAAQDWYNRGVAALREGTYLKATNALQMAVDRDPDYVLAHARLADAWNELDFTAKAKDEMLQASSLELERNLPNSDKQYVEAVRATILRNFPDALHRYNAILKALPKDMNAYGYVDLGRAYEKTGNIDRAIWSYSNAKVLAPDDPASYLRLGILESRRKARASDNPEKEFAEAEKLYSAASNFEGIAEVQYQRGYAANREKRLDDAERFLNDSLETASRIPSVQLEVRALAQLSATEYSREQDSRRRSGGRTPIDLANESIRLARENGLEYWATDGIMRLGSAYFADGDYAHAESYFKDGLQLAQKSERPRLIALAELNLATLRDQQGGKPDDVISFAQKAFDYYHPAGFFVESTDTLILIARAMLEQSRFREALQRGQESLALTVKAGNPTLVALAEEVTGGAFLGLQNYPEALEHYQAALKANPNEYNILHCAEALWRLGRYSEGEQMIAGIPGETGKRPDVAAEIARIAAEMRLSQKQYRIAFQLARSALRTPENQRPSWVSELQITAAIAESHVGRLKDAETQLQKVISASQFSSELMANAHLALANVYFSEHAPQHAKPLAEAANTFFASSGQREAECLSLLALAKVQRALGDGTLAQNSAAKALDILSEFEHNWSISNRPDLQDAARELATICRK